MSKGFIASCLVLLGLALSPAPSQAAYSTGNSTASASISQQIKLTILPAIESTVISSSAPEQQERVIYQDFTLGIRANTAWALDTQITTTAINASTCQESIDQGPRNQDDGFQQVAVSCQQPLSWADQPGTVDITWQVAPALGGGGISD